MSTVFINSYWVSANWWPASAVRVYIPKGAASLAASYFDYTGNQDAAPGVAPDWDAVNGWKPNGSTHYLTTGFTPDTDQSQAILIQFTNGPGAGGTMLLGSNTAGGSFAIQVATSSSVRYRNGGSVTVAPNLTAGNLTIAGSQGYRNGVAEGAAIAGWGGAGAEVYIGCWNNAGTPGLFSAVEIQAVVLCNAVPTAGELATAWAAMAAL